jgi:hypothetical protein
MDMRLVRNFYFLFKIRNNNCKQRLLGTNPIKSDRPCWHLGITVVVVVVVGGGGGGGVVVVVVVHTIQLIKPGKLLQYHRVISLLRTSYEIVSNILLSRLSSYADEIVGSHPRGFRRNRSTTDHNFLHSSDAVEKMRIQ